MEALEIYYKTEYKWNSQDFFSYFLPNIKGIILENNEVLPELEYFLNITSLCLNNFKEIKSDFIIKMKYLIKLSNLRLCNLQSDNVDILIKNIYGKNIESLVLKGMNIKNDTINILNTNNSFEKIKELNLSYNKISYSIELFLILEKMKSIEKLDLSYNPIGNQGLNNLSWILNFFKKLKYINLSFISLSRNEACEDFFSNLSNFSNLQEIIFSNRGIILSQEFYESLSKLREVRKVDFSYIEFYNFDSDLFSLSECLSKLPKLKSIYLDAISLEDKGFANLIQKVKNIEEISLRRNKLSNQAVNELFSHVDLNPDFKYLDLSYNKLSEECLKAVLNVTLKCKKVETLKIDGVCDLSVDKILKFVKEMVSSKVNLSCLNIFTVDDIKEGDKLSEIGTILKQMNNLRKLKLNCSRVLEKSFSENFILINK